jgi:hypothetical protein
LISLYRGSAVTLKVLKFQSIQTLSIQTLRKIYREVREAGSWPSHTYMPRRVALKPQAERLVPLSLSLARPIQSPPTRLREGQQFYGLLGNYLLSIGGSRHLQSSRQLQSLQTSPECELLQLFQRTHLFSKLAKSPRNGQASPMGKHANPMHNPVFTYSPATPR